VKESKLDPDLVTVAVDLNVKNLAVITVRQQSMILETVFVTDHGLDQQRLSPSQAHREKAVAIGQAGPGRAPAINRFGGMCGAKMRMLPTRWRGALLVCARDIPAVSCSLSDCARSSPKEAASHDA